jgi:X-Pro dipeptidyl-peptidase
VTVDLAASRLTLPVTGRATLSPGPADAQITTAPAAPADRRSDDHRRHLPR